MSNRLVWSPKMSINYLKGLTFNEKVKHLITEGYDPELFDESTIDSFIDSDKNLIESDLEDLQDTVIPMVNGQTYNGYVLALDIDNNIVSGGTIEEILSDGYGQPEVYDDGEGLAIRETMSTNGNCNLQLYIIPTDTDAMVDLFEEVFPEALDSLYPEDEYDEVGTDEIRDFFMDSDLISEYGDAEALKQFGTRVQDNFSESTSESVDLEEDIPDKRLARAMRNHIYTSRDFNGWPEIPTSLSDSQSIMSMGDNGATDYYGINSTPEIDFNSAEYKPLTADDALELYKQGKSRKILCVIDGQLCNKYLNDNGKKTYDMAAKGSFTKDSGEVVDNSKKLTPSEFYRLAEKDGGIYQIVNEPLYDKQKKAMRLANSDTNLSNNIYSRTGVYHSSVGDRLMDKDSDEILQDLNLRRSDYNYPSLVKKPKMNLKRPTIKQYGYHSGVDFTRNNNMAGASNAGLRDKEAYWKYKDQLATERYSKHYLIKQAKEDKEVLEKTLTVVKTANRNLDLMKDRLKSSTSQESIDREVSELQKKIDEYILQYTWLINKVSSLQEEIYNVPEKAKEKLVQLQAGVSKAEQTLAGAQQGVAAFFNTRFADFFGNGEETEG